jgi:hypothetical protein
MLSFVCIGIAFTLALSSSKDGRAFCFILLIEFIAHKFNYVITQELTDMISGPIFLLINVVIEMLAVIALSNKGAGKFIRFLITLNIGYNVAIISQYSFPIFDFYGKRDYIFRTIMIAELLYMLRFNLYARIIRSRCKFGCLGDFGVMFSVRGWICNWMDRGHIK